jgi:hypothetical membrane protein
MLSPKRDMWIKIAGFCGVLSPILTLTLIAIAISYYPPFNWTVNALSDLGIQENSAIIFNSSLIIGGIIALFFAYGLKELLWKQTIGKLGVLVFISATISMIAIGVFPENVKPWHFYASVAFFLLLPISQFLVAAALLRNTSEKLSGFISLFIGIVSLFNWAFLIFQVFPWQGIAIPELIASVAAATWSIVFGIKILKH